MFDELLLLQKIFLQYFTRYGRNIMGFSKTRKRLEKTGFWFWECKVGWGARYGNLVIVFQL
jgi:hypothetical protein